MNRQLAIDAPITLGALLGAEDVDEVARAFAAHHAVGVAIADRIGAIVATAGESVEPEILHAKGRSEGEQVPVAGGSARCWWEPLVHEGEVLGAVVVGPYAPEEADAGRVASPRMSAEAARRLARHVVRVVSVLIHHAHARYLTTEMHVAAMNDTFTSLEAKNEQLTTAIERMQEFDRLKSNFLATVSHELRTPLTSVIGYSEMLLEGLAGPLNEEQRDYIQTVLSKADQLLQLITGILDTALMEAGTLRVAREPIELRELLEGIAATFAPEADKRGIGISLPKTAVPRVLGDGRKIRQVFWNLFANAVKFTGRGGDVTVDWRVGPLSPEDDTGRFGAPPLRAEQARHLGVRVAVRDSGIGISAEKQEHIFEPFFQVDSSSTREYGGTGLGLTLAKRYVEAHGGHIWVDSELGVGSVFSVSLPAVPDDLRAFLAQGRATEAQ